MEARQIPHRKKFLFLESCREVSIAVEIGLTGGDREGLRYIFGA